MQTKRFQKNDEGFVCGHCGKTVLPLGSSSRNHCPFCLWSRHLDVMPGDRASECGGMMRPIKAEPDSKRGLILIHKCEICGCLRRNKAVPDAKTQPDDRQLLIALTAEIM